MSKEHAKTFQDASLTLDVGCIIGAFAAAVFLRTYQSRIPFQGWIPEVTPKEGIGWSADYLSFLLLSLLLWIAVMKYAGVYHSHRAERLSFIVRIYLQAAVLCGLGAGFMAFAFKLSSISRLFTFYFF